MLSELNEEKNYYFDLGLDSYINDSEFDSLFPRSYCDFLLINKRNIAWLLRSSKIIINSKRITILASSVNCLPLVLYFVSAYSSIYIMHGGKIFNKSHGKTDFLIKMHGKITIKEIEALEITLGIKEHVFLEKCDKKKFYQYRAIAMNKIHIKRKSHLFQ